MKQRELCELPDPLKIVQVSGTCSKGFNFTHRDKNKKIKKLNRRLFILIFVVLIMMAREKLVKFENKTQVKQNKESHDGDRALKLKKLNSKKKKCARRKQLIRAAKGRRKETTNNKIFFK